MGFEVYLVSKAVRTNEELSNAELHRRMTQTKHARSAASAAGMVVPGAGELAAGWDAERKFRVMRNARAGEARALQRSQQRSRTSNVLVGVGAGTAIGGAGGLRRVLRPKAWKSPRKVGVGAGMTALGLGLNSREGRLRRKVENDIWDRTRARYPDRVG